jgi:hypothetical protein
MGYNTSAKIRLYGRMGNLEYTNLLFSLKCFGNRYQSFFSAANLRFIARMLGLPLFMKICCQGKWNFPYVRKPILVDLVVSGRRSEVISVWCII